MKTNDIPLGTLIDSLNEIRESRRDLAARDKELETTYKEIEEQIKVRLEAEGMDKATGKKATASIGHVTVATIKDWDALCKYVKKTGYFHLFQRRISDPAFREILELKGGEVPGLEAFDKKNLNLRSLSDKL